MGRGHGRRRFGRGGGLGQEGGLLVGAGPGGEPDGRLRLDGVGRLPVMQEARAGVVARTGPAEVRDVVVVVVVVQLLGEVREGVLLRVRELQGALAGVVQGVEGGVVAGSGGGGGGAGLVGRRRRRLVDVGERLERQVRAVLQRPGRNGAVHACAELHETRRRFLQLFLPGRPVVSRERRSHRRRFTRCSHFTLLKKEIERIWNEKDLFLPFGSENDFRAKEKPAYYSL